MSDSITVQMEIIGKEKNLKGTELSRLIYTPKQIFFIPVIFK